MRQKEMNQNKCIVEQVSTLGNWNSIPQGTEEHAPQHLSTSALSPWWVGCGAFMGLWGFGGGQLRAGSGAFTFKHFWPHTVLEKRGFLAVWESCGHRNADAHSRKLGQSTLQYVNPRRYGQEIKSICYKLPLLPNAIHTTKNTRMKMAWFLLPGNWQSGSVSLLIYNTSLIVISLPTEVFWRFDDMTRMKTVQMNCGYRL